VSRQASSPGKVSLTPVTAFVTMMWAIARNFTF
jgi:hypothetical protein